MSKGKKKHKHRLDSVVIQRKEQKPSVNTGIDFDKLNVVKLNTIDVADAIKIAKLYYPDYLGKDKAFVMKDTKMNKMFELLSGVGSLLVADAKISGKNVYRHVIEQSTIVYNQVFSDFYMDGKIDLIGTSGVQEIGRIVVKHNSMQTVDLSLYIENNSIYSEVLRVRVPYKANMTIKTLPEVHATFSNATLMYCDNRIINMRAKFVETLALWWYQICACMIQIIDSDYRRYVLKRKRNKDNEDCKVEASVVADIEERKKNTYIIERKDDNKGNVVINLGNKKPKLLKSGVCSKERKDSEYRALSWEVRGTLRHYKSGKTVWIKPRTAKRNEKLLEKGKAEEVKRTYKVKESNDNDGTGN